MLLGKGLLRGKTLSPRVFHLVRWPGRRRLSAQGSPTHCREVSWPAFDFCRLSTYLCSVYLCSVFCAYLCSVYLCSVFCACVCTTQLCRPVLSGPVEEPKGQRARTPPRSSRRRPSSRNGPRLCGNRTVRGSPAVRGIRGPQGNFCLRF